MKNKFSIAALVIMLVFVPDVPAFAVTVPTVVNPVVIGVTGSLNGPVFPYLGDNPAMNAMIGQQFATLLKRNPDLSLGPELVTKYWYADNGLKIYMQLSKKAKWSNGTPLTSRDVADAVNFLASPYYNNVLFGTQGYRVMPIVGAQAELAGHSSTVSGFHIVNQQEFYFQLQKPDATVLNEDLQGLMPLPSQVIGSVAMTSWLNIPTIDSAKIGSGPFILSNSNFAQASMHANSLFVFGKPKLGFVNFISVSAAAAPGLLKAGQIDLYQGLTPNQANSLSSQTDLRIESTSSNAYTFLSFRDNRSGYIMPEFRQAVEYALNRQAIIQAAVGGYGTLENGPIPPSSFWYNASLNGTYPYSPQTARNILSNAGFHIGSKNWLVQPNGAPINPVIEYVSGDPYGKVEAQVIVTDLQNIAIDAKLGTPKSTGQMVRALESNSSSISAFVMGWHLGIDPDPRGLWRSTDANNLYTVNWTNTLDTAVQQNDQLIKEQAGVTAESTNVRQGLLNQWQTLLNQQMPENFLFSPDLISGVSTRLQGVVWSSIGPMDSWMWYVSNPVPSTG